MMGRSSLNVEVIETINYAERVKKLNNNVFDFVLLGCQIPIVNGIQLLQEILHFAGTSAPIFFDTGKGDRMIAAQAIKIGTLDYIPNEKLSPIFYLNVSIT